MPSPPPAPVAHKDAIIGIMLRSAVEAGGTNTKLREEALAKILAKWPEPRQCPVCNSNRWNVADLVVATVMERPGQAMVYVPVSCLVCTYTMFFDALALELATDDSPDPPMEFR